MGVLDLMSAATVWLCGFGLGIAVVRGFHPACKIDRGDRLLFLLLGIAFLVFVFVWPMNPTYLALPCLYVLSTMALGFYIPRKAIKRGVQSGSFVGLIVMVAVIDHGIVGRKWAYIGETERLSATIVYARAISREIGLQLMEQGANDQHFYQSGILLTSEVVKKYPSVLECMPHGGRDRGYLTVLIPRKAWHSVFTRLVVGEEAHAIPYFNGGKLSEPDRVSLLTVCRDESLLPLPSEAPKTDDTN